MLATLEIALGGAGFGHRKLCRSRLELLLRHEFENFIQLLEICRFGLQIVRDRESASPCDPRSNTGGESGIARKAPPMENRRPSAESLQTLLIDLASRIISNTTSTRRLCHAHLLPSEVIFRNRRWSHRREFTQSPSFSFDPRCGITLAPRYLAIWIAAMPTPLLPP